MSVDLTDEWRALPADETFAELARHVPVDELARVRQMFDVWAGRRTASLAPMQRSLFGVFMPGVPSAPWYDPGAFAWSDLLEDRYPALRAELDVALADDLRFQPYGRTPDGAPLPVGSVPPGWKEIKLCWSSRPVPGACARLPQAAHVMEQVLEQSKVLAQFSYLAARTGHPDP